jgi:membrane-anchored protein YejM (alkaline phosphatase superfamily)
MALDLNFFASIVVIFLCSFQGYVSWRVSRSEAFSRKQKGFQLALVWLVPFIGAMVVHWFATKGSGDLPSTDKEFERQDIPAPGVAGGRRW